MTALLIVVAPAASACAERDCKEYAAFGLIMDVVDSTGAPVCDAAVRATDGDYYEVLVRAPSEPGGPCPYRGAVERKGTYAVQAARGAAASVVTTITLTADGCHVRPVTTTITLGA